MPCTPTAWSASFTSSSLNGLMTASIFFMGFSWEQVLHPHRRRLAGLVPRQTGLIHKNLAVPA
jgi:hypothetical protein